MGVRTAIYAIRDTAKKEGWVENASLPAPFPHFFLFFAVDLSEPSVQCCFPRFEKRRIEYNDINRFE
jgi:hypothetical protein